MHACNPFVLISCGGEVEEGSEEDGGRAVFLFLGCVANGVDYWLFV